MKIIIHLKDIYPDCVTEDPLFEVDQEIADVFADYRRLMHAQAEQQRYNHVVFRNLESYSDSSTATSSMSPQEMLEHREAMEDLYAAINTLSESQKRRIIACYILGMSQADIARAEGTNRKTVCESIQRALGQLRKNLQNFS
jgi:RNA polymerase sigma-70 factor, ECF subfamily